jgi:glycosyltransferase involved in cell wall biosynthesis
MNTLDDPQRAFRPIDTVNICECRSIAAYPFSRRLNFSERGADAIGPQQKGRRIRMQARAPSGGMPVTAELSPEPNPADAELSRKPIRVFVHLARGFGAAQWQARWDRGEIIGFNERLPYGFFWAEEHGCSVEYSEDRREGPLGAVLRLAVRLVLGFDLAHAWRNRRRIYVADVVWTGTESQYLAVLLLLRLRGRQRRPKVIAQTVWLFDTWPRLSRPKRSLYQRLIAEAAVITVHSVEGLKLARALFPHQHSMFMPFAIRDDVMVPPRRRVAQGSIRVLSAGSDRHRDWATLVAALRDCPDVELRIVAPRLPVGIALDANVTLVHPKTNDEYIELYRWADLVALALNLNRHGSGITVIEEATVFGVPVVVTDIGGLRGYFSDREVRYVPAEDPTAMRDAVIALATDVGRKQMVERAQRRIIEARLTSRGFAQRHAELSVSCWPVPGLIHRRRRQGRRNRCSCAGNRLSIRSSRDRPR